MKRRGRLVVDGREEVRGGEERGLGGGKQEGGGTKEASTYPLPPPRLSFHYQGEGGLPPKDGESRAVE